MGRDVLSRLAHGARYTILIGVVGAVVATLVGWPIGWLASRFVPPLARIIAWLAYPLYIAPQFFTGQSWSGRFLAGLCSLHAKLSAFWGLILLVVWSGLIGGAQGAVACGLLLAPLGAY